MDSIDRRLVEINEALIKLSQGYPPNKEQLDRASQVISGGYSLRDIGGPGNDTIIINKGPRNDCPPNQGPQGPSGEIGVQGPPGEPGPTGPPGANGICGGECKTVLVSEDYNAQVDDCYIGVNSPGPVNITLPSDCANGSEIIIKAQMGPPLGNRKITVLTDNGSFINGADEFVIEIPYGSVRLICNGDDWWVV